MTLPWNFGVAQAVFWRFGLEEAIKTVTDFNFKVFELWCDHPLVYPILEGKAGYKILLTLREKYGISYTVHAPPHDVNIASINEGIRRESLRQILRSIEIAYNVDSPIVTLHPGRLTTRKVPREVYIRNAIDSLNEIADYAERYGVKVGVENMECNPQQFLVDPTIVREVVESVNSKLLGVTLDIAHANTCGDPIGYIEELKDLIIHVHLSNNFGGDIGKVHLPLNMGNMNVELVLRKLHSIGYKGVIVLEGGGKDVKEVLKANRQVIDCIRVS